MAKKTDLTPSPPPQPTQPKILRRMLVRFAVGLFVLAGLLFAYQGVRSCGHDVDLPVSVDTAGHVAAVEYLDEGSRVVVFTPDGEVRPAPGYEEGMTDKDPAWTPDGNRLYFISDREERSFHAYRWNLGSDRVDRRSTGSRSLSQIHFPPESASNANKFALVIAGGYVLQFDPKVGAIQQVMPPVPSQRTGEGEGVGNQFEAFYQQLGAKSFREALWPVGKTGIAAVARREDGYEMLLCQSLIDDSPPSAVGVGDRVYFDVSPLDNTVFYSVVGFTFPDPSAAPDEYKKDGRLVIPFRHVVGMFQIEGGKVQNHQLVTLSESDDVAFTNVKVSPDGLSLLMIVGKYDDSRNVTPEQLVVVPATPGGVQGATVVLAGPIYQATWGPDSSTIYFIRQGEDGKGSLWRIRKDGSGETDLSKGRGNFGNPIPSPQSPRE